MFFCTTSQSGPAQVDRAVTVLTPPLDVYEKPPTTFFSPLQSHNTLCPRSFFLVVQGHSLLSRWLGHGRVTVRACRVRVLRIDTEGMSWEETLTTWSSNNHETTVTRTQYVPCYIPIKRNEQDHVVYSPHKNEIFVVGKRPQRKTGW